MQRIQLQWFTHSHEAPSENGSHRSTLLTPSSRPTFWPLFNEMSSLSSNSQNLAYSFSSMGLRRGSSSSSSSSSSKAGALLASSGGPGSLASKPVSGASSSVLEHSTAPGDRCRRSACWRRAQGRAETGLKQPITGMRGQTAPNSGDGACTDLIIHSFRPTLQCGEARMPFYGAGIGLRCCMAGARSGRQQRWAIGRVAPWPRIRTAFHLPRFLGREEAGPKASTHACRSCKIIYPCREMPEYGDTTG